MKNPGQRILFNLGKTGIDVYIDFNGGRHYVATIRNSFSLWGQLPRITTLHGLATVKPGRSRVQQHYYRMCKRLAQMIGEFIKEEITA